MNDREALYAAILAQPDEDTPRLAFADYVEEHGEGEYAAFMRKQIELSKVEEWDELWIRAKYFEPETVGGKNRLLPELPSSIRWDTLDGDEWCGPFRRGFPSAIADTSGADIRDGLTELLRAAPVNKITWYGDDEVGRALPHWSRLVSDAAFAQVRSLNLALARLTGDNIRELHDSPHAEGLTELGLVTCDLTSAETVTFLSLPHFRRLRRLGLRALDDGTGDVLRAAGAYTGHHLTSLHIHCGLSRELGGSSWSRDFLSTPLLCGLREIDLTDHRLGPAASRDLACSPAVVGVKSLRLWFCSGEDELAVALAGCAELTFLRQLELYGNGISPRGARAIAESPYLANLRVLELSGNSIGDEGATALARSPHLSQLLDLQLLSCQIGDAGAKAFLDSQLAGTLVHLELRRDDVGRSRKECSISEPVARRLRERFGNRVRIDPVPPLA